MFGNALVWAGFLIFWGSFPGCDFFGLTLLSQVLREYCDLGVYELASSHNKETYK